MWSLLLRFCTLKLFWIFGSMVFLITIFLMIVYNSQEDELRKCILSERVYDEADFSSEQTRENVDEKLQILTEELVEKEKLLKQSQCDILKAEKLLHDMEFKTLIYQDRYKFLMIDLKKDVQKTEDDVKVLQNQVSDLSSRRKALREEVRKQQEDHQKMLKNLSNELDTKEMMLAYNSRLPLPPLNVPS